MTILVATPIRSSAIERWSANVKANFEAFTCSDKELALMPNCLTRHCKKYEPNAIARNCLLDSFLKPCHTHVLWLDCDLVKVPPDLIESLLAITRTDVIAPFIYVEQPGGWFYDMGGFVRDNIGAAAWGPIFTGYAGGLIELDSVGACYLAPAEIYREHCLRYFVYGDEVEHRGLLMKAKCFGYRVLATDAVKVEHAYLPNYGEQWHS